MSRGNSRRSPGASPGPRGRPRARPCDRATSRTPSWSATRPVLRASRRSLSRRRSLRRRRRRQSPRGTFFGLDVRPPRLRADDRGPPAHRGVSPRARGHREPRRGRRRHRRGHGDPLGHGLSARGESGSTAIETNAEALEVARALVAENDCAERVELLCEDALAVTLPERAHVVVVSDLRGGMPLAAGHWPVLAHARRHFLARRAGALLPSSDALFASPSCRARRRTSARSGPAMAGGATRSARCVPASRTPRAPRPLAVGAGGRPPHARSRVGHARLLHGRARSRSRPARAGRSRAATPSATASPSGSRPPSPKAA